MNTPNADTEWKPLLMTAGELKKKYPSGKPRVRKIGNSIFIQVDLEQKNRTYEVDLDRCDTAAKALSWCAHLAEKTWMTGPMIRDFIVLLNKTGIAVDWTC